MGFSVTIASSIILITLITCFACISAVVFYGFKEISYVTNDYLSRERERFEVKLELNITSVNATSCDIIVKNVGCKTVFFQSQNGFRWNTILFSYGNASQWHSYPIEQYEVLEIKVSGTNSSFSPDHSFINPGEEAKISFSIPEGAPEVPLQGVVSVTFVTHYGVTVNSRAVREQ